MTTKTKGTKRNTKAIKTTDSVVTASDEATTAPATTTPTTKTEPKTKEPKPLPTLAEALATAKAKNPARFAHVLRVTELTKDGEPKRVVIECTDPQTKHVNGAPVSVCEGEREIAVQDLFQVYCCAACADRKVRKARRERAKRKDKALRQAVREAKASR